MKLSGFICHDDYLSKTARLSDGELGRVFRALMQYHSTGEEVELDVKESMVFDFIRVDIDRQEDAHKAKCEKNKEIRLQALENERQRSSTNVNERDLYKDKDKDKEKDNNNNTVKTQKRFTPPTVDEVADYCKKRGNNIDPEYFVAYYATRNWVLSNGRKMTNWRMAIITWEKNNFSKPTQTATQGKTVVAQQYTQRDYEGEDAEAFRRMLQGALA